MGYERIIKVKMTAESFNQLFDIMLKKYDGDHYQAYEATEHEHQVRCRSRKYSDFESFRVSRSRTLNKKVRKN